MQSSSTFSRGYILALTAVIFWSFSGILISYLSVTYAVPSIVIAFWSVLFVALGMFTALIFFSRERFQLDISHLKFMVLYGFTFAVFHTTWTLSVQYNGAAVATFLVYSSPAMTAILSRMIFKERFNPIKILSIVLSLIGTIFVSGAYDLSTWGLNSLGIVFGLLSGPFFAFYNLEGKYSSDQSIDPWTAVFYCFSFAAFFLFFFNIGLDALSGKTLLSDMLWLGNSVSGWGILFLLGIGPTLGGFGLYTISLRHLTPTVANLIATLEPAFTAIWAYFLLNERLTLLQWAGSILVLAGVILLRWGEKAE
ncbi:MAG TPA: DMT family transporter [Anaerolineales bacterium]|nr:DMT family transporter [Anaerolineales bacterium]